MRNRVPGARGEPAVAPRVPAGLSPFLRLQEGEDEGRRPGGADLGILAGLLVLAEDRDQCRDADRLLSLLHPVAALVLGPWRHDADVWLALGCPPGEAPLHLLADQVGVADAGVWLVRGGEGDRGGC